MDSNAQNIKIELIQWLVGLEDVDLLKRLLDIRKSDIDTKVYKLSEAELKLVEEGLEDLKHGNTMTQSEAKKIYGKWL